MTATAPWDPAKRPPQTDFQRALMRERQRMQFSRRELADQCGVGERVVKRWEDGEAIPSVQQFKRLFGMKGMRRLAKHPPQWGVFAEAVVDGRFEEHKADVADAVRQLQHEDPVTRPPPQTFGAGLLRIREENEISQDALGEILGVSGQAVSAWERDETVPVQENFDKLLQVLPELEAAISVGAVRLPEPKDIPKPVGGSGRPSGRLIVTDGVTTMLAMALENSDAEVAREPQRLKPRWTQRDMPDEERPAVERELAPPPLPPSSQPSIDELAAAYARARVRTIKAKRLLTAAMEALTNAQTEADNAARDEQDALALLDLAIAEEVD